MVLNFDYTLSEALDKVGFTKKLVFNVYNSGKDGADVYDTSSGGTDVSIGESVLLSRYGDAKWGISSVINGNYGSRLKCPVDLYNWLFFCEDDEVSYFVCEMGANVIHHQGCFPECFEVYLGSSGFVLGVVQNGLNRGQRVKKVFNAVEVDVKKIFSNSGGGFSFLRRCKGVVFFDNPFDVRVVYYVQSFE